jgi:hypothetical protein
MPDNAPSGLLKTPYGSHGLSWRAQFTIIPSDQGLEPLQSPHADGRVLSPGIDRTVLRTSLEGN